MTAIVLYGNEGSGQGEAEREKVGSNLPNSTNTSYCFESHASDHSDCSRSMYGSPYYGYLLAGSQILVYPPRRIRQTLCRS